MVAKTFEIRRLTLLLLCAAKQISNPIIEVED